MRDETSAVKTKSSGGKGSQIDNRASAFPGDGAPRRDGLEARRAEM